MFTPNMSSPEHLLDISPRDIVCDPHNYEAGSGGNCDVLIGFHKPTKQAVAIKVAHVTGGPRDKALVKRTLKEEMEYLQKANHENIVRVLGWVEWEFSIGIVMEYCKGGNLKQLALDRSIPLGVQLRLWLLVMIAKALAFCHSLPGGKRLLHCDVKPENSLLTDELVCKLGDFGTAELTTMTGSTTVDASARSKKERPQHTPYYTAPEKLRDPTMKPTKKLDSYAFGVMMYMMLARVMPYPPNTSLDDIKQELRPNCREIEDLKQTLNDTDRRIVEELEQMMKQCWDQDPSARPTMTEVSERLQQLLDQQETDALKQQVANVLEKMDIKDPFPDNHQERLVPISKYLIRTRKFEEATPSDNFTQEFTRGRNTPSAPQAGSPMLLYSRARNTFIYPFVKKYRQLLEIGEYEEAKDVTHELSRQLDGSWASYCMENAKQIQMEMQPLEKLFLYKVAFDLFLKQPVFDDNVLQSLLECVDGVGNVRESFRPGFRFKLLRDLDLYLYSVIHDMKRKLLDRDDVNPTFAKTFKKRCLTLLKRLNRSAIIRNPIRNFGRFSSK